MIKSYYNSPIGLIEIESSDNGITSLVFVDEAEGAGLRAVEMTSHRKSHSESINNEIDKNFEMTSQCILQLDEYFHKKREVFNLKLDLKGTDFQKRVWEELLKIPFGKTISYKVLTLRLGNIRAIRAVGAANGANPVSIIVPCHRIIGSDGSLTGYAGGLWRKKWLLDFEGKDLLFLPEG